MAYLSRDFEPEGERRRELFSRSLPDSREVDRIVEQVLSTVRKEGDSALFSYGQQFDHVRLQDLAVSETEFAQSAGLLSPSLRQALDVAARNIEAFHRAQLPSGESLAVMEGVSLSRKIVPIDTVGLYVPGGTAPLFSTVLMLAIPAKVAGCRNVVLCSPPDATGAIHPAILYAARLCGVDRVFKVGGAQAVGAMAYGTESIPRVDKIFGPGNRFVTAAKKQVGSECVSIDMPAGPSEVMVVATVDADPAFVASDLLSQAEHGADSQAMLVIQAGKEEGFAFLDRVEAELSAQMAVLDRHEYLLSSLSHSHAIVSATLGSVASIVNEYAPEHLIVNTTDPGALEALVSNAGSIFLGPWSCESAGDYASGTNHTLPTGGWAHSCSGVSIDSFVKKITVQTLSREGLALLGPTIETMAEAERLTAHKNAVSIRLGRML
jgi:histidinol dehydrogenase